MSKDVKIRVLKVIKEQFKEYEIFQLDKITEETTLSNDLGMDSLDAVEILMKCEQEFNLTITD